MPDASVFDALSLPVFLFATLAVSLAVAESGYRYGLYRRKFVKTEDGESVGTMVASALGLVGFLLAFTFGIASNRFEDKRKSLHDEVNAIGTTYLRADFLPEPHRGEAKRLLKEYVDTRLQATQPGELKEGVRRSEAIQDRLWANTLSATSGQPPSIYVSLFIQSLNEMIDLHTVRMIAGIHSRIPDVIWYVLLASTFIGFAATGYHAGIAGRCRSPLAIIVVLLFSIVIGLIMDLDRTNQGMLRVNQAPMIELKESLR